MATTSLRIAEVLRHSGLITPSEVLTKFSKNRMNDKSISREAQALRNYREEAVNIDDNIFYNQFKQE